MFKRISSLLFASFLLLGSIFLFAAERMEWKDENGDGRKESQFFYEGDQVVKIQMDRNGDGKTDQWLNFKNGKKATAEIDSDFDGRVDQWITYDSKGKTQIIAKDTNHDGKPDQFQQMLKGRELVLKEYDRNFDGRIDKRMLMQWDANKKITTFMNGRPGSIPNPGYTWLRKEEDNNFDGKIDVYQERGNKNPSTDRIGKEIDPLPAKPEDKGGPATEKKQEPSEGLIQKMNEKYGLK